MSTPKRVRRELDHCHAVIGELRAERDKARRFVLHERAKRHEAEKMLARLHSAVGNRMMADDPTAAERLEILGAWTDAGEWLAALLPTLPPTSLPNVRDETRPQRADGSPNSDPR